MDFTVDFDHFGETRSHELKPGGSKIQVGIGCLSTGVVMGLASGVVDAADSHAFRSMRGTSRSLCGLWSSGVYLGAVIGKCALSRQGKLPWLCGLRPLFFSETFRSV
jgi:hypothetical protein